jgi:hypothetical protein
MTTISLEERFLTKFEDVDKNNKENIDYLNYLLAEDDWGMFM